MGFFQQLEERIQATGSLLVVGLDPHPADLSEPSAAAALAYCRRLVELTRDYAVAYKPNAAFFEAFGADGFAALAELISEIPDDIPTLLDVKRGDISSTAAAYSRAAFEALGAGAVTLSPWMGRDSVQPFVCDEDRGAFLLCRTSNPGGADLQDRTVLLEDGTTLRAYELLADLAGEWNEKGNIGLVVGATRPAELAAVRARAPEVWILAPGVGAQGASLDEAMAAGLRSDGSGLLIPVSRGIARADDPRAAAAKLVEEMRAARARHRPSSGVGRTLDPSVRAGGGLRERVAAGLLDTGCVRFGTFTLKSGLISPIYVDLRRLVADPSLLKDVALLLAARAASLNYDLLAALPYAAMPIGTALSLQTGEPMIYPRKEVKAHGTKAQVEGVYEAGQVALVVDDLATTGGSKIEGIERLRSVGVEVHDVLVLIDRESGAAEAMAAAGVGMHALFTLTELLGVWSELGAISTEQLAAVHVFLEGSRA